SHRATWRIQNRRGSNRRWMKVQWQVNAPKTFLMFVWSGAFNRIISKRVAVAPSYRCNGTANVSWSAMVHQKSSIF
ncbi:hypothetical protein AB9E30_35055, partial [Rhizobium leguminosarum]